MGVRNQLARPVRRAMAVAVMSACASSAFAIEFETEGGWRGSVNTTIGISSAWRMQAPDKTLIMAKNAAAAGEVPGFIPAQTYPGYDTSALTAAGGASGALIQNTIATLIATTPVNTTPGLGAVLTAKAVAGNVAQGVSPVTKVSLGTALAMAGVPVANIPAMIGNTTTGVAVAASQVLAQAGVSAATLANPAYIGAIAAKAIGGLGGMVAAQKGLAAGYLGGAPTDDADLSYKKGDRYSTNLKVLTEVSLQKNDSGALLRVKGWYDEALKNGNMTYGHQANGYQTGTPMSDNGFALLNRFDGLALLDAYVYSGFEAAGQPLQVRLGRQAVNWGESLYIQGVNQLTPLDITALRRAGTEVKEALLPVWSITGNLGLPMGASMEGFYQFKWEPHNIDTCGTYLSPVGLSLGSNAGQCNMATSIGFGGLSNKWSYLGSAATPTQAGPFYDSVKEINHPDPSNGGQWGLSLHFPVAALDTEFGLYAMNIHSRTPILSGKVGSLFDLYGTTLALRNPNQTMLGFWEYPEDIKIYGLSAATTAMGWSVGAELSLQKDVPVQVNGNDMLIAGLAGGSSSYTAWGPAGARVNAARATMAPGTSAQNGAYLQGYDRYDKTQFQINGVYLLPALLGATNGQLIAETGFQWNNVPKNDGTVTRYGRSFIYGFGSNPLFGSTNAATALAGNTAGDNCTSGLNYSSTNPQPTGCLNDGYVNDFAWGYRIKASLDYPNFMETSWTATPSVFWAHDVKGYSMDSQFNEGRKVLAIGLRMSLNKVHTLDFNFTTYADSAKYDATRDRDNVSVAYSYTF